MGRLFITGASGFVGFHIAQTFIQQGWEVTALVRESSSVTPLQEIGVSLHRGDLLAAPTFQQAMEGADVVVHCAGLTKALSYQEFRTVNAQGAGQVARAASIVGVPRLILISSIAARGPGRLDVRDTAPISFYGKSKSEGEQRSFQEAGGTEVAVLRPPPVYGPGDRGMLDLFKFARRGFFPLWGRGNHRTAIVHVEDLAEATFALAARSGKMPSGPFYPEDGTNVSWGELAGAFAQAVRRRKITRLPLPGFVFQLLGLLATFWSMFTRRAALFSRDKVLEMAQPYWECSHRSLTRATGWKPRHQLVRGLAETYLWYRKNGWLR
jgi:nucleoside-diphosphate-sugar epimerase